MYQRGDFTSFAHHFRKARGGDHDEADHGEHFHAFGKQIVGFFPLHHARKVEQQEACQCTQDHRAQPELNHEGDHNGNNGHDQCARAVGHVYALGTGNGFQIVFALAAVGEEYSNQQAAEHAKGRQSHGVHNAQAFGFAAVGADFGHQYFIQVNAAEADGQEHVGCDQTKGERTGYEPTVHFQFGHHVQHGRNDQRDECDMDGQDVL